MAIVMAAVQIAVICTFIFWSAVALFRQSVEANRYDLFGVYMMIATVTVVTLRWAFRGNE